MCGCGLRDLSCQRQNFSLTALISSGGVSSLSRQELHCNVAALKILTYPTIPQPPPSPTLLKSNLMFMVLCTVQIDDFQAPTCFLWSMKETLISVLELVPYPINNTADWHFQSCLNSHDNIYYFCIMCGNYGNVMNWHFDVGTKGQLLGSLFRALFSFYLFLPLTSVGLSTKWSAVL